MESNAKCEEVAHQKLKLLELEQRKYSLYQTLLKALEETVETSEQLNEDIKDKIRNIMLSSSCTQHIIGDSEPILGVSIDRKVHLTIIETNNLNEALEQVLNDKYKGLLVTENDTKTKNVNGTSNEDILNSLRSKQNEFVGYILRLADVVEQLKDMKTVQLPQVLEKKVEECNLISRVKSLQAKITEEKFKIDVFTETEESLKAYKEISKDIKQQTDDCLREVEELDKLKLKYKGVSCKEYDEILLSYLKLKLELEGS